jgi:hypothetical protein
MTNELLIEEMETSTTTRPTRRPAPFLQLPVLDGPTPTESRDPGRSGLVNFPFAFTVFMILIIGLAAIAWGMFLTSAWLALAGCLVTLVGGISCGWSLSDQEP